MGLTINTMERGMSAVVEESRSEAEDTTERHHDAAESLADEWGRSESLDPDNVGDIADEGAGHRG